jgi:hypothetical protein
MKKIYVIKNVPTRLPVVGTVLYAFLMDYYNASDFWWGVFIVVFTIIWIICIYALCLQETIDLTKDYSDNPNKAVKKGKFAEKLQQLIDENKK